jgi:hypothetical protein
MDENDRIALAFVEIGDFDSAVVKARHRWPHLPGKMGCWTRPGHFWDTLRFFLRPAVAVV